MFNLPYHSEMDVEELAVDYGKSIRRSLTRLFAMGAAVIGVGIVIFVAI